MTSKTSTSLKQGGRDDGRGGTRVGRPCAGRAVTHAALAASQLHSLHTKKLNIS